MGSWADRAISELAAGEDSVVIPHGNSMRPRIFSGARVTLSPVDPNTVAVGDAVLCRVKGNVYLHLVKAIQGGDGSRRFLIGNNRGGTNGWTTTLYGIVKNVENP